MRPSVEIISLIYKSTRYAAHISSELSKTKSELADISWRLVANDPTPTVKDYLLQQGIPHSLYFDDNPNDYYLNRVYRAWNASGKSSESDLVCFVNSDMFFPTNFIDPLLDVWFKFGGNVIPCSLLLESGRMPSKYPAYTVPFGQTIDTFNREIFELEASRVRRDHLIFGGLYMPCILPTTLFKEGKNYFPYPEGNLYKSGVGRIDSEFLCSGDEYYFRQLEERFGLIHLTVTGSVCAHLQSGEMFEE